MTLFWTARMWKGRRRTGSHSGGGGSCRGPSRGQPRPPHIAATTSGQCSSASRGECCSRPLSAAAWTWHILQMMHHIAARLSVQDCLQEAFVEYEVISCSGVGAPLPGTALLETGAGCPELCCRGLLVL